MIPTEVMRTPKEKGVGERNKELNWQTWAKEWKKSDESTILKMMKRGKNE